MDAAKLKHGELKAFREKLIEEQDRLCPLCGLELLPEESVLDHCHTTGHVRQALHRSCNSAEGTILHWAGQRSKGDDHVEFTRNLITYWEQDYSDRPLHPKHGKPIKRRKRKAR